MHNFLSGTALQVSRICSYLEYDIKGGKDLLPPGVYHPVFLPVLKLTLLSQLFKRKDLETTGMLT